MAQLSDDCFAFGGKLQSVDAALATIASGIPCIATPETIPLLKADGRILAADLFAPVDLPPFPNAAVDGYAVRHQDLQNTGTLPIQGRATAGAPAPPLQPGTTLRIFTGAPLPQGADTIYMQEDITLTGTNVTFPPGLRPGANTRPAGEDIAAHTLALPKGQRLRPQHIALAAALGIPTLQVRRRLRIALFSTGNELVDPGTPPGPAQRHDSNRILLAALARRAGAEITDLGILPDHRATIATALHQAAPTHDLILTSGGVSTGEEDHVRAAVEQAGRLVFWRIAIKPGRPVAMGQIAETIVLGLPGNPVAAFITFIRIARPLLAALSGEIPPTLRPLPVQSGFHYRKKPGRREYVRALLTPNLIAQKHPTEGAGILTSLTNTDGLIELPDDLTTVTPGDPLAFIPYDSLF